MQTFLTHPSFNLTARSLDNKRLGKQRVETYQILLANKRVEQFRKDNDPYSVPPIAWRNHPAVLMWRHYDHMLAMYGLHMCKEWKARGFRDSLEDKFESFLKSSIFVIPPWISDPNTFHKIMHSHRYSLVQKDSAHYAPQFPEVVDIIPVPYYWPSYSRPSHYFDRVET